MAYEYKCVGAPEKAKRRRGAKTRTDRVAAAMQDIIAQEAVGGWEYLRTDLVPVEEKSGLFGRVHEVHRAVLIFRRGEPAGSHARAVQSDIVSPAPAMAAPAAAAPHAYAPEPTATFPEPAPTQQNTPEPTPDDDFRLAAHRDEPADPAPLAARPLRAPQGLG
ncbi:MAG: hypothetical protein ACFB03_09770 [Paracoccaceae bacterium]